MCKADDHTDAESCKQDRHPKQGRRARPGENVGCNMRVTFKMLTTTL